MNRTAVLVAVLMALSGGGSPIAGRQLAPASQQPDPATLTPASVALLGNRLDVPALEQVRTAITHENPDVRAVAARVAGIAKAVALAPHISTALAREGDEGAAAEQIRALLFFETPPAIEAAERHLPRAGTRGVGVYLGWLVRTRSEKLADRIEHLLRVPTSTGVGHLSELVARAVLQNPPLRGRLLRAWLSVASGAEWRQVLDVLATEALFAETGILRQALESEDALIRQETVWAIVTRLVSGLALDVSALDAAAADQQPSQASSAPVTWETYGRELLARHHRRIETPDRAEFLKSEAPNHVGDARTLSRFTHTTAAERSALREALGDRAPGQHTDIDAAIQQWPLNSTRKQPTMRTLPVMSPQLFVDLLEAVRCEIPRTPNFGAFQIAYRPDGRPASIQLEMGTLPRKCEPALAALARLTVADPNDEIAEGEMQWVIVPVYQEFVACAVEPPRPVRPKRVGTQIKQPRKTRDVRPEYPQIAQQNGVQGMVILEAIISGAGCVNSMKVLRSVHPLLDIAALKAVAGWRYTPTLLDGHPVPVIMTVTVNFTLR